MSEHTSLGRRALLAGMGAGVASLAGCLDRSQDTAETTPLEVTGVEGHTDPSGGTELVVEYTAPEDVGQVAITTGLYRDDRMVRRVTEYLFGVAGNAGHTIEYLNTGFDDHDTTIERFDGLPDESGDVEVSATEAVSTDSGSEVHVELVAPEERDRLAVSVDLFDFEAEIDQSVIRTITDFVSLDGESGTAVTHAVTTTPFGWVDDYSVRVTPAESA